MATMKDIARLAGVSHGTVSNVLNNKGNVSADKIRIVRKAAGELGYSLNEQARQLRSQLPLTSAVAIILPNVDEARYAAFYCAVQKFFQGKGFKVMLYTTEESPFYEEKAIQAIISSRAQVVISVSCFINNIKQYEALEALGCQLFFVERKPPQKDACFGFDYYKAGLEVGLAMKKKGYGNISLVIGLDYYANESDFQKAFIHAFTDNGNEKRTVEVFSTSYTAAMNTAFDVLAGPGTPDAVVCSSEDIYRSFVEAADTIGKANPPYIYTISHTGYYERDVTRHYVMNYSDLGLKCAAMIYHTIESGGQASQISFTPLKPEGFRTSKKSPVYFGNKVTLNLLMASSSSTSALIRMAPEFTRKSNIELNFVVLSLAELTDNLATTQDNSYFDIIRTNVTTTPGFSSDALMPMEQDFFDRLTSSMFIKPVQYFSYIKGRPFAVPFDFSMYFLIYHKELFDDAVLSRQYLENNGVSLKVPETYVDYNQVAKFFTRKYTADSPVEFGTTAIINENTTIVYDFYRRYLSFGGKLVNEKKEPCFDVKLAYDALINFLEMMDYSIVSTDSNRKDIQIHNLLEGKTALEIASAAHTSELVDIKKNRLRGRIDFTNIPKPWHSFGGGALAISANSPRKEEALSFIEWACSEEQAMLFARLGGLSPHKKVYSNSEITQMYPWFSVLRDVADTPYEQTDLDFVDRYKFERLLGITLRNTYHKVIDPKNAASILHSNIMDCMLYK